MASPIDIFITWKGEEVIARTTIIPADPDVGIMGPSAEEVLLINPQTKAVIPTSDAEQDELCGFDTPIGKIIQAGIDKAYYDVDIDD